MSTYKQDIRGYLEYGKPGETRRVEITAATIAWGLRELPTAVIQVAVGRDTRDGKIQPAFEDTPSPEIPAKLYIILKGPRGESSNKWDGQPKLAFDGFINSFAATRLANQSAGNFTIRHWLSSLQSANILASYAHPGAASELVLPAYIRRKNRTGADLPPDVNSGTSPSGLRALMMEDLIYAKENEIDDEDIWATVAKPFLVNCSKQRPFSTVSEFRSCFPGAGGDNLAALEALSRIEGESGDAYALTPDQWNVPVILPQPAPGDIISAVRSTLTKPTVGDLKQHTAWSYILSHICQPFMLSVIPGIDRARVVPVTPAYNQVYKELDVDQVTVSDRNRPIEHPMIAVTMSAGQLYTTGVRGATTPSDPFAFGPCFSPPKASKFGQVKMVEPPAWLRTVRLNAFDPSRSSRAADGVAGGTMEGDDNSEKDSETANDDVDVRTDIQDYGYEYVKAVYAHDTLKARTLKAISYLRFDIAPGSQVKIITNNDIPGFGDVAYAMVARVTMVIDATRPFAATSFMLSHVRGEDENQTDYLGADRHPLFKDAFSGAPLSAELS